MPTYDAIGTRVGIRRPTDADCDEFLALTRASEAFHQPWVDLPKSRERYEEYLASRLTEWYDGFFICDAQTHQIVGVINLNVITRGALQSAYLGYWIGESFARKGYMTEGIKLVTQYAFTELGLHRVEANIQPGNLASIALVRKCGFQKEGFSPKYLRVFGEWRDHERWALLAEVT